MESISLAGQENRPRWHFSPPVDIQSVKEAVSSAVDVMQSMASSTCSLLTKYFLGTPSTYSQEMIDELRDMWVNYLNNQIQDDGD